MSDPTDEETIARATDTARSGELVDYDTIPKHLWDRVGKATTDVHHAWWRAQGWDVRTVACDRGCCTSHQFTPPSRQPVTAEPSRCTRGVKY